MKKKVLTTVLLLFVSVFSGLSSGAIDNPRLIKLPLGLGSQRIENTPVMYQGRPLVSPLAKMPNWHLRKKPWFSMRSSSAKTAVGTNYCLPLMAAGSKKKSRQIKTATATKTANA